MSSPTDRVLVVDSTGRGHAICDLFVRTNPDVVIYYGPGCDVIEHERILPAPSVSLTDPDTALEFLRRTPVEFVFVANIDALATGYVDVLVRAGHRVIGPRASAAALESSKARGKQFCLDHGIPVAEFEVFTDAEKAREYVRGLSQCVVKTDGLTPDGDGSVVCGGAAEAVAAVDRLAAQAGGELRLLVEERLTGPEVSVLALLDGTVALIFPLAMDYKRTLDGDLGKNCDGMGSISPHPADSPELRALLRATLLEPLLHGLADEGLEFTGFVYLGAMLTPRGPVLIEINARFGDSEAEAVLPGVRSDFTALCRAVLTGELDRHELDVDGLARCSVALVQGSVDDSAAALPGWPFGAFAAGQPVRGLDAVDPGEASVFYANLRRDEHDRVVTAGGRVLHVVGAGSCPEQAHERAYRQLRHIEYAGRRVRSDIGRS